MQKAIDLASGVALFLAGMAAGVLSSTPSSREGTPQPAETDDSAAGKTEAPPADWRNALGALESRIAANETAGAKRFEQVAATLLEHAAKLSDTPSHAQIEKRLRERDETTRHRLDQIVVLLDDHSTRLESTPTRLEIENRLAAQESATAEQFSLIVNRLDEHASKLAEAPSAPQIVSAVEQMLAKAMTSLDERLATQANSIGVLTTTVAQTDNLLEKVLESLDTLQSSGEQAEESYARSAAASPGAAQVSIQKAGEMPQSVRSSVEYLLGRPIGPEEEVSIAATPPRRSMA
jgi:chromosome segregation ATPase